MRCLISQNFQLIYFPTLSHVILICHFCWKTFSYGGLELIFLEKWKINPTKILSKREGDQTRGSEQEAGEAWPVRRWRQGKLGSNGERRSLAMMAMREAQLVTAMAIGETWQRWQRGS